MNRSANISCWFPPRKQGISFLSYNRKHSSRLGEGSRRQASWLTAFPSRVPFRRSDNIAGTCSAFGTDSRPSVSLLARFHLSRAASKQVFNRALRPDLCSSDVLRSFRHGLFRGSSSILFWATVFRGQPRGGALHSFIRRGAWA